MSNDTTQRALGLSTAQVIGSALAAMSAALIASWAGTTGTIIGAAVGSIVATVGAATYTWSLRRTSDAVRRTAGQVRLVTTTVPRQRLGDEGTGPLATAALSAGEASGTAGGRPAAAGTDWRSRLRLPALPWGKVLLASATVAAVAIGGITTLEAISGRTASSLTGGDDTRGTSIGQLVSGDSAPRPATTGEPGGAERDVPAAPEEEPAGEPAPEPTVEPTPAPTPAPSPVDPEPAPGEETDPPTDLTPSPGAP